MDAPYSLWDLSSLTGIEAVAPALSTLSPNHWTAREFQGHLCLLIVTSLSYASISQRLGDKALSYSMIISQRTALSSLRKIDMACKSWQQIPTEYFVYGSVYVSMILSQLGLCKNLEGWDEMGSGR